MVDEQETEEFHQIHYTIHVSNCNYSTTSISINNMGIHAIHHRHTYSTFNIEDFKVIQRTNVTKLEAAATPKAITLAKYGITQILHLKTPEDHWELPWLKKDIILHLRACTSIDSNSIEKAVEALQSFKIKTEVQKETKLSQI